MAKKAEKRAVLYARVSTAEQAEQGESIAGQLREMEKWAREQGYLVTREFVEPGRSGTDANRPVFREMVEWVSGAGQGVALVLVHSTSRFMRNARLAKKYKHALAKAGVRVKAVTQDTGDGPNGALLESIFEAVDEHSSAINGVRTRTGMTEIARQGYVPIGRPPFGFDIQKHKLSPTKSRNKLVVNADEAVIIRRVFGLYLSGRGMKAVASELNELGIQRRGRPWTKKKVGDLLSAEYLCGTYYWGRGDTSGSRIEIPIPKLLDERTVAAAADKRRRTAPQAVPGRTASSPMLLAGLLRCSECGGRLTLQTSGKAKKYRYYACQTRLKQSRKACGSKALPERVLDEAVLRHIADQVFTVERCRSMLKALAEGARKVQTRAQAQRDQLRKDRDDLRRKIERWEQAFEAGSLDPVTSGGRYEALLLRLSALEDELEALPKSSPPKALLYREGAIEKFQARLRAVLLGEDRRLAKAYVHRLIERIDVAGDEITLTARAVEAADLLGEAQKKNPRSEAGVRTSVTTGLRQQDSNL